MSGTETIFPYRTNTNVHEVDLHDGRCELTTVIKCVFCVLGEDTKMRFNMKPGPGNSDFEQWQSAMKMVARLPDGVPHEFRNTVNT